MKMDKQVKAPTTGLADDPNDRKGPLKNIGGSQSDHWNNILANQVVQALWVKNSDKNERDRQLSAAVAALIGIAPKGELGRHDGGTIDRRSQRGDGVLPARHDRGTDFRRASREPSPSQ